MPNGARSKVVVVTGASAGIGRAVARAFAGRGDSVGLIARGREGLDGARRDVEATGARAHAVEADVADAAQMERAAAEIEQRLGPIDIWVNNAMASVFSPFAEMTADEFERVTDVTYHGYVWGTMAALTRMKPRNRGHIVQVGSALAYRGIPLQSAYCGTKHAVQGFTESVRSELMHDGSAIRLTMVQLPAHNTPQFRWVKSRLPRKAQPVPPIYQPEVAADAVVWVTEHYRREIYVGWAAFRAILFNRFFPGIADWYLAKTGYEGQMVPEPRDPQSPHNLWEPLDAGRDYGAHGVFDDRAKPRSRHLWLTMNRRWLALAGLLGLASAAALRSRDGA